jgi:hypothetical protein
MQIFLVKNNGETEEIKSDRPIKELLNPKECFILNDDILRVVYHWKGKDSGVRSKFIGAKLQQDVRGQVGLNYRTVSMDEEDNDMPSEFRTAIENNPGKGIAKEIRETGGDLKFEVGVNPVQTRVYQTNPSYNQNIEQTGPLYTADVAASLVKGSAKGAAASSAAGNVDNRNKLAKEKIIELLDAEKCPEGYEREMVIVGDSAYSVAEKVQTFLGKKTVEKVLEPIASLPEGIFFAEGYIPRVLVQNKQILGIEFLKRKE